MEKEFFDLSRLSDGEKAKIIHLENEPVMKRRLFDLGFVPETTVECIKTAPFGDPKAYLVKNTVIALREEDSAKVKVKKLS